jgi:hypothetical protein
MFYPSEFKYHESKDKGRRNGDGYAKTALFLSASVREGLMNGNSGSTSSR